MFTKLPYEKPSIEVLELRFEGMVCASDPEDQDAKFSDPAAFLDDLSTIIWF